jgi:uncharacterized protein (DUF433 family)
MARPPDRSLSKIPAYTVPDAALFLGLAPSTARWWTFGRGKYRPAIRPEDPKERLLSFENLVELHVLSSVRGLGIPLPKIRAAVRFLEEQFNSQHPLATEEMFEDGKNLLVKKLGVTIEASNKGQTAFAEVIDRHLRRIEREKGVPMRLYPFLDRRHASAQKLISIDPRIQFGRPCIAGTGIPAGAILDRWKAGETISDLSKDFNRGQREIEDVVRYAASRLKAA